MKYQTLNFVSVWILSAVVIKSTETIPVKPLNEEAIPKWAQANDHDKLEGDIKLSPNVESLVEEGVKERSLKGTRGAVKNKIFLWSNAIVPYEIDSTFDYFPDARKVINDAIASIHQMSCIRFVQRTSEQYYVRFVRGHGCWSYVGELRISGGQPVSIGDGCDAKGTVLHEVMHALGFFHTSSRYDRDSYVVVMPENIMEGLEYNFQKYNHDQLDRLQAPYDMTSLMHLPKTAWSKNGHTTIEARAGPQVMLGRSNGLSDIDKAQLNLLYRCWGYPSCHRAFGMEQFQIADSQLSASSHKQYYEPHQARLHLSASSAGGGAWCAVQNNQQGEWLQVDLGGRKKVTGIATQGKMAIFANAWTTYLEVWYSQDQNSWYQAFNGQMVKANFDMDSAQYSPAPVPFIARYVRFEPKHWYNDICLRVEIYGCDA